MINVALPGSVSWFYTPDLCHGPQFLSPSRFPWSSRLPYPAISLMSPAGCLKTAPSQELQDDSPFSRPNMSCFAPKPSVRWRHEGQRLMQPGAPWAAPSALCIPDCYLWPQDPSWGCILSSTSASPLLTCPHSFCTALHVKSRHLPRPPRRCRSGCPRAFLSSWSLFRTSGSPHSPCHRGGSTPPHTAVLLPSPTPSFRCWHPTIPRGLDIPRSHAPGQPHWIQVPSCHSSSRSSKKC